MEAKWIGVVAAVVIGFVLGLILSALVRRILGKPGGDPKLVEVAPVVASLVFYICLIAGMWTALAISSPDAVADVPEKIINSIPNVVVALILVLGARVLGSILSVVVGQSLEAATGRRNPALEAGVGGVVLGIGVVLALDQLGVSTTIINIMVAGIVFAASLSFALLVGFGGRSVARDISAGRALRNTLVPGATLRAGIVEGEIGALNPVAVEVETDGAETVHVPYHLLLESTIEVSNAEQPTEASPTAQ